MLWSIWESSITSYTHPYRIAKELPHSSSNVFYNLGSNLRLAHSSTWKMHIGTIISADKTSNCKRPGVILNHSIYNESVLLFRVPRYTQNHFQCRATLSRRIRFQLHQIKGIHLHHSWSLLLQTYKCSYKGKETHLLRTYEGLQVTVMVAQWEGTPAIHLTTLK